MTGLASLVRLEDPNFYLDDPYPVLQRLRREDPVFYYEPLNMWVMSKYVAPMEPFFEKYLAERDRNPTRDLLTVLQQARRDGLIRARRCICSFRRS